MKEVEMTELEEKMLNAVEMACKEIYEQRTLPSTTSWTIAITKELVQLGKNHNMVTCANYGEKDRGEWLWDICWIKTSSNTLDWNNFRGVKFACEIVWERTATLTEILEDYLKLVIADCEYRLFIFEPANQANFDEVVEKLMAMSNNFSNKNGFMVKRFMVIGVLPWNHGEIRTPLVKVWMT